MKALKKYKIEIFGLKNGTHQIDISFDEEFFAEFENSLISKGKGTCDLELVKSDSMLTLIFNIEGSIELECDRSLELFDYPIAVEKSLIYKYGEEEQELSEDVYVIPKGTQEINIATFLYEMITLEIPMKKLHPKFQGDDKEDEVIFSSDEKEEEKSNKVDPRWEALKKLK